MIETVYLVYENQYKDELPECISVYTRKGLIEHAEQCRQDFIKLENHQAPIQDFDEAVYFLEFVTEHTIIEKHLL